MGREATFRRENERLPQIVRRRYFETSVVRVASIWTFDEGWYDQESDGQTVWYWMGKRGKVCSACGEQPHDASDDAEHGGRFHV